MRLEGKTALITGAGSGIGAAIAKRFAAEGAAVAVLDIRGENAQRVAAAIAKEGGRAIALTADVSREGDVRQAITDTVQAFGTLHVLVNNAAITAAKTIEATSEEDWDRILAVNLKSMFWTCKYALSYLKETRGAVRNIGSMVGVHGQEESLAYCASKGGVLAFTKAFALDVARYGIRANTLCPASVSTPLMEQWLSEQPDPEAVRSRIVRRHPLGWISTPEEIASAALFLVSGDASFITGIDLWVDGGSSLGYKS